MENLFLTNKDIDSIDASIFKTLTFFYDSISVDLHETTVNIHFDEKVKLNEFVYDSRGYLLGFKGALSKISEKLWDNDKKTMEMSRNIISLKPDVHLKFQKQLIYPYRAIQILPTISNDLFEIFKQSYYLVLKANPQLSLEGEEADTLLFSEEGIREITPEDKRYARYAKMISDSMISLFEKGYMHKLHSYEVLTDSNVLEVLNVLSHLKDIKLGELRNYHQMTDLFPKDMSLGEILDLKNQSSNKNFSDYSTTLKLVISDLTEVPISEIYKFRKTDNIKSVFTFVSELRREKGDVSDEGIINEINEHIYKLTLSLKPSSVKQTVMGVLGNLPSPIIVNPISVFSLLMDTKKSIEINKKYAFVFDFLKFRERFKNF